MSETLKELQARLTEASPRDYSGCLALFQEARELSHSVKRNGRDFMETTELMRRCERLLAQAVAAAQLRGEVRSTGQSSSHLNLIDVPHADILSRARPLAAVSDEIFELAIKNARSRGSFGRTVLIEELELLTPKVTPEQTRAKRAGTVKGKRTIEHMAIQVNALAMGTGDINPEDVPSEVVEEMITGIFRDIGTIRSFLRKVTNEAV